MKLEPGVHLTMGVAGTGSGPFPLLPIHTKPKAANLLSCPNKGGQPFFPWRQKPRQILNHYNLQVSNPMPYYVHVQNERKKGEMNSTRLHRKSVADWGQKPTPPPFQQLSTCPVFCPVFCLVNQFGDFMLAEVHFFALSWQEFTFTASWATNTTVSLQFSMHFVCVFYISLRSHLLSQDHMLPICSKALKCDEKGTITNEKGTVDRKPTISSTMTLLKATVLQKQSF